MDFYAVLDQAVDLLRQRGRVTYRALQLQFQLNDDELEALKDELLYAHPQVVDDAGRGLRWTGAPEAAPPPAVALAPAQDRAPLTYTPPHLAEKILTSRVALEGERKQVTVLFADIKDSTELIKDLDPEAAQQLIDPAIHIMMEAVHRFEGTVNQVLGDGIMALFGAPIAHEDHALRAGYAALAMQAAMQPYAEAVRRQHENVGLAVQAYLYRTEKDLERLQPLRPKIRLVKGAYREPPRVAFPAKRQVDENYRKLMRVLFSNGFYTAIATHDDKMLEQAKQLARELNCPPARWEFQMILGVRRDLQEKLVRQGYRLRVYIPFGREWLPYFMRRLAERPANLGFVVKSMLKGG